MTYNYVAHNNDFSEWDNDKEWHFIKEDKNGSRYYTNNTCPKCGGTGKLPEYKYIDDGVCYMCNGSGFAPKPIIAKVYMEGYYDQLLEKRRAKKRAHAAEHNAHFFEAFGLSDKGEAWIVLGDTYKIKDELKEAGARFKPFLGWYFNHEPEKYDSFKLSPETIVGTDFNYETQQESKVEFICFSKYTGEALMTRSQYLIEQYVKEKQEAYRTAHTDPGEYVGEIGKRITLPAIYKGHRSYETQGWGYQGKVQMFIEMFEDETGNILVWKTTNGIFDLNKGDRINLTGTIKDHNEYNHIRQTLLSRCKVS